MKGLVKVLVAVGSVVLGTVSAAALAKSGLKDMQADNAEIEETGTHVLEFFDGPNGCGARKIIIPDPPPNTAKLQITCHDYSLGQLKNILASLPAGTSISGTIHIAL